MDFKKLTKLKNENPYLEKELRAASIVEKIDLEYQIDDERVKSILFNQLFTRMVTDEETYEEIAMNILERIMEK